MKVFTRDLGESIQIGPDIFVRIVQIKGKKTRIGIEAPNGVEILAPEKPKACPACGEGK